MMLLTTLLPVLILGLVNMVVFLIPVESGEELSFAITVLLSFTENHDLYHWTAASER